MVRTTSSPMDMTTPTPAVDTTISTVTTTISTESDAISTTTTRSPIPDTTTSPLSVYFVLQQIMPELLNEAFSAIAIHTKTPRRTL